MLAYTIKRILLMIPTLLGAAGLVFFMLRVMEAPWMIIFPGLAISLAVFAFNLFGDSLRDWLDPKITT